MKRYIFLIFALFTVLVAGAQISVTGTVYEPDGQPAIGASVIEKGVAAKGAVTDLDGKFRIKVTSSDATLIVSYVGLETQEVSLSGRRTIEVYMTENSNQLSEIVVVGYGTQKRINATGAVRTIDNEVLRSRPVTNAVEALQGAVAGLNITNDAGGETDRTMQMNIRGVGSIGEGSNSAPLILIDGMEGDLNSINPDDIESVSVLKDAAAASIYGSRAPFGVILVTTKSGQADTRVNYSGNVRFLQPVNVPRPADSYTMALMVNDAWTNAGGNPQFNSIRIDKIRDVLAGIIEPGTEAQNSLNWKGTYASWGNTDWYKEYVKNVAVAQEHNASVSGGSRKVKYYFSGNYLDKEGIFRHADERFKRMGLSGRINIRFNDYVTFAWTSRIVATDNNKPSALGPLFYHNLARRYATEPVYLPNGEYHPNSLIQWMEDGGRIKDKTQQFYNQANLIVEPVSNWKIHAEINSRIEHNPYSRQFKPVYYTAPDGSKRPVAYGDTGRHEFNSDGSFNVVPEDGESYYEKANRAVNYFSTNFYTDYSLTLGSAHNFKFLAGVQTEYYHHNFDRVATSNVLIDEHPFIPSESGSASTMVSEVNEEWSTVGVFGRINYNYDDRYMIEVNMRGDGASRFPRNQRWGYFPSASVGWNIAQENFWRPLYRTWNYFKLRADYGVLGNQNTTSFYPYYEKMATNTGQAVIGGSQATILPVYTPYSTSLTWEKIENVGAGVDFGLLNSRLNGSFDWFRRTTKDMVGPAMSLPGVYGAIVPKTNNAELRTNGWELELSWRDHIGADFSYGISAALSDYSTVITKYYSSDNNIKGWYQGKKYGEIWGFETLGIAKSDREMNEHIAKHPQSSISNIWGGGDIMYKNQDSDPAINKGAQTLDDHGDLVVIGNTTPRYAYSFTLDARWKFLDIRAFFQGIGKRDYFFGDGNTGNFTFFGYSGKPWQVSLNYDHLDYFRFAGSLLGANDEDPYYGRLRTDAANIQYCDRFLQDASYLRLKNLTVGVSLPQSARLSRWVKKARLYFAAENLFTITKLRIFDPEAIDNNAGYGAGKCYPQYRTYSVGLELSF